MLTREYGNTGIRVSAIGFGGMRFTNPDDLDESAALVIRAYEGGVTYFDTAPGYCHGKSEIIFGQAFRQMRRTRHERPFTVSTKSAHADPDKVRADVENSLRTMELDTLDVLHVWCVKNWDEYIERKRRGVLRMVERLREEGLVRHIAISTHMRGEEIDRVLRDYPFEGVLLGYSAMNFPYREAGVQAAAEMARGVVVMNPLGGGMIPQHPERFDFLCTDPDDTVARGALRFLLSDARITVALVGMANPRDVDDALAVGNEFTPLPIANIATMRARLSERFNKLCTGCGYCEPCPRDVPITKLMDAYNQYEFQDGDTKAVSSRLRYHWGIALDDPCLDACVQCGRCEGLCTQKLPIEERLRKISEWAQAARQAS